MNILVAKFKTVRAASISVPEDQKEGFVKLSGKNLLFIYTEEGADRELTEQEKKVLKEFEDNDRELERIAEEISKGLEELADKGKKAGKAIEEQNEML